MKAPDHTPYRCWAEIDLAALERNLRRIRTALPEHIRYVAVVKADAYGHGLVPTVTRLMQAGTHLFAVANPAEARAIRTVGTGWPILILGVLLPGEEDALLEDDLIGTVSSPREVERFEALGARAKRTIRVHLKIDTGMGRLGVWHEEALPLLELLRQSPHVRMEGMFTHFSDADSPDNSHRRLQRERFLAVLDRGLTEEERSGLLVHADNSASVETFARSTPFNAVRIGLLQFGVMQYEDSLFGKTRVEPVFSFRTRVGLVKQLPAGTPISYGREFVLQRDSRVAVLTGGYGDGIPVAASNRGKVLIRGQRCPILGRVTMDQTMVDVTDLPGVEEGEVATLIGSMDGAELSVTEFSRDAGTIPWETFCTITKRVPRVYLTRRE